MQGKHKDKWRDWTGNQIGVEGARALSDALKTNTTLTVLGLGGEQQDTRKHNKRARQAQWHVEWLEDNKIDVEGARALCDALKTNTTLTELSLGSEQQDHKEAQSERARQAQWHVV